MLCFIFYQFIYLGGLTEQGKPPANPNDIQSNPRSGAIQASPVFKLSLDLA